VASRGRISSNAASQLLAQALVTGLSLISSPILVHGLGLEAYGLLVLVGITTSYFGIVDLGLGRATVQVLARHRARDEHDDLLRALWTATGAYLALGIAGALALVAAAPVLVTRVLAVSPTLTLQARWAFVIGAAGLVLSMQRDVAAAVATALERFDLVSRVTAAFGALQTVVNIALVWAGATLAGVMTGGLAVQAAALAVYWLISRHLVHGLWPPRFDAQKLRSLLRFGGFVTVSQVVAPLLVHVEKVLIGALTAVDQVPYYAVPYSLAWGLTFVPTALVGVLYPALARLVSTGDAAGVRETLRRANRYVFLALLGPAVLVALFAREILAAWMGASFAAQASGCLRLLALAMVVNVLAWPSYQLLHAAGRADITARYHVLELVLHVPLSVLLIARFGILGAAVAWLLRVVLDTALLFRAGARVAGVGAWSLGREAVTRGVLVALALLPVALLAGTALDQAGRVRTAVILALIGIAYVPAVVWFGLPREERDALLVTARTLLPGVTRGPAAQP
jgi:O-antigen/teichoic acid export membrane protein